MPRKTPPHANYPRWTEARFNSFIRSALRRAWLKWPPRYTALSANRKKYTGTDKRIKWVYTCDICKQDKYQKEIQVDHKEPAGSLNCYDDLPGFVERLFTSEDKLRILCKECHTEVTAEEKKK